MQNELKNCAHCGGLPKVIRRTAWDTPTYIQCTVCGSTGPHAYVAKQEDSWKSLIPSAVSGWNTRPAPAATVTCNIHKVGITPKYECHLCRENREYQEDKDERDRVLGGKSCAPAGMVRFDENELYQAWCEDYGKVSPDQAMVIKWICEKFASPQTDSHTAQLHSDIKRKNEEIEKLYLIINEMKKQREIPSVIHRLHCCNQDGDDETEGYYISIEKAQAKGKDLENEPGNKKYGIEYFIEFVDLI